ncbi:hypothetical protein [Flavobacterium soli]|uniref:hypothetical protein n=1 Tax=Flavobacterium soli TaxID=344881 RepID=UPI0004029FC2|nr:hypothetical protein [Flavobacterium soli]
MNTIELKKILISKISEIDDNSFLEALNTILDHKTSEAEKNEYKQYNFDLLKAEEDIENGKTYSHEEVKEKVALWKKR